MNGFKSGMVSLVAAVGLASLPFGAAAQSLTDALISAYNNSEELKAERAQLQSTNEGVRQAWSATMPSLALSANATASFRSITSFGAANHTYTASVALVSELTLWDGGATELAIESAQVSVAAGRETLVDTEQQVLLAAVTAFMDMRRDAQFLDLAENNFRVIARQLQAAQDRFEVGEAQRTEVSRAEARLADAQSIIALRQGGLEISRDVYYYAIGAYPGNLASPPPLPSIPRTLEAAKAIAVEKHPVVLRARQVVKIAELNVARADAAMKPNVTLSAQIGANPNVSGDNYSISLGATMPLYRGGQLLSVRRQTMALKEKALFDLQHAGQLVSQNVTRFWAQYEISSASITARQKEVRASRVALRGIREEANLGARTTLDVLDAERELLQAETNLISARRDQYVAVYSLLSAMGLLTVRHLGLGIKTYDTNADYNRIWNPPTPTERSKQLEKIFKRAGRN
ncbi:MAG: TolC family outer membrane protein [Rhodobacteraceae bacterium]|nr:TolC family outer membrane protein [Paracoccaceae bacterium]